MAAAAPSSALSIPGRDLQPFYARPEMQNDYEQRLGTTLGPRGNADEGEIEIVSDFDSLISCRREQGQFLLAKKASLDDVQRNSRIGVLETDGVSYRMVRDAVRLPNGKYSQFKRYVYEQVWQNGAEAPIGISVLPYDRTANKVRLQFQYRHAYRNWCLEAARGFSKRGESPIDAAIRELKEETGIVATPEQMTDLGIVDVDTGVAAGRIQSFLAEVSFPEAALQNLREGIVAFTDLSPRRVADINRLREIIPFSFNFNNRTIHKEARMEDPYALSAITQAIMLGKMVV